MKLSIFHYWKTAGTILHPGALAISAPLQRLSLEFSALNNKIL